MRSPVVNHGGVGGRFFTDALCANDDETRTRREFSLEGPSLAESGCAVSYPMRSADLSPECYETVDQEAERFAAR
jgi:hypothetical protein